MMETQQAQSASGDVELLLGQFPVHKDWIDAFSHGSKLLKYFCEGLSAVRELVKRSDTPEAQTMPDSYKILLALSRCSPADIKVVIVGQSPIDDRSKATGFAFSFPKGVYFEKQTAMDYPAGHSLRVLREVILQAGYSVPDSHDLCHEEWADRGVLLLNASLTLGCDVIDSSFHFEKWRKFTQELLLKVIELSNMRPLFFLFWGTNAQSVSEWLSCRLNKDVEIMKTDTNQLIQYADLLRDDACRMQEDNHLDGGAFRLEKGAEYLRECAKRLKSYLDRLKEDKEVKTINFYRGSNEENPTGKIVFYVGHHPTYPRTDNKFPEQAKQQFQTIKKCYPDLFNLKSVPEEGAGVPTDK